MVNMEEISDTESSNEESGSDYDEVSTSKKTPTPQKRKNPPAPSTPSSVKPKKPKTNLSKSAASSKEDTSALTPTSKPTPKSGSSKSANTDGRSVDDIYKKKTQVEHILLRPDTYIGAVEAELKTLWVYDSKADCMVLRPVNIVPGLYKIFDEILVNAADNKIRDPEMDTIKVTIDRATNTISVFNNGRGIPVEIHQKEQVYVPELIFGHLLTSSNYDDDEKKIVGGRNGYGAKLANIFSNEFIIETSDNVSGKKFKQVFTMNMSKKTSPKITTANKEDFTRITFKPDLAKFGMETIDDDLEALLKKRVYDLAGCVKNIKVFLNDERIKIKNFKQYVEMYLKGTYGGGPTTNGPAKSRKKKKEELHGEEAVEVKVENEGNDDAANIEADEIDNDGGGNGDGAEDREDIDERAEETGSKTMPPATPTPGPKPTIVHEIVNERWEVAFIVSEGQFQQVSFVNSISTSKGGTHVGYVADQITAHIVEVVKKKNKGSTPLKAFQVKSHLWVFLNCLIENPAFDSQTKEYMTLPPGKFGSTCVLSEDFLKRVITKTAVTETVLALARFKQEQLLKKTDGRKKSRISGIAKLDDANNAGTRHASRCTLVITEGDSAKALAVSGLSVVGRDDFGVFPLRGKPLNVRDASNKQIQENQEINNIKQILGLQHGKTYDNTDSLRYGHLMIMTDQDHDGSHIKGLIINFLDKFYPSLLQQNEFLMEFITPIVRATKGKKQINFYTIPEYEAWKAANSDGKGWHHKYYKGLGTSNAADAKKYFGDLDTHVKIFEPAGDEDHELIDLAFSKKRANNRKEWLGQFQLGTFMDHKAKEIAINEFVNKELILFSMADNVRSIPSVMDGLKPGQRKILYTAFRKNLKNEIKVAQLVGLVSQLTAYHHGEASLFSTIVGLAQTFVGSNNINLLLPNGQFGTRSQGGKDAASARYIFTALSPLARLIFHKDDDPLLTYLTDDGSPIEPQWFVPIIPMVLVNGTEGIGTGWSTKLRPFKPIDIAENLKRRLREEQFVSMQPWYRGFKGTIEPLSNDRYKVSGILTKIDDTTLEITELPIGMWTQTYKEFLESGLNGDKPFIKDYREYHTDTAVHFIVTLSEEQMRAAETGAGGLESKFRMTANIDTAHMVCFDSDLKIKKYANPEEILEEFFHVRLRYYDMRKDWLVDELRRDVEQLNNQVRFIIEVNEDKLKIRNRKKADVLKNLKTRGYKEFPPRVKQGKAAVVPGPGESDNDSDSKEEDESVGARGYDYLLNMSIGHLTYEKAESLKKVRDAKQAELESLIAKPVNKIWIEDLDVFVKEWLGLEEEYEEIMKDGKPLIKTGKGKGRGKGKKKSIKDMLGKMKKEDEGEDEEYTEGSQSAKKNKASKSAASTPSRKSARPKNKISFAEDDDEEMQDDGEIVFMEVDKPPEQEPSLTTLSIPATGINPTKTLVKSMKPKAVESNVSAEDHTPKIGTSISSKPAKPEAEGEADSGDNFTKPPTKVSKLKPKSIPDPKVKPALKVKDESSPTGMAEKRSFSARGKGKKEDVVSDSSDQDVSSASPSLKRGLTKSASVSVSKKKKLSVVTKARSVEEDIDDEQEVPEAPRRTPRRSVRKIMKTVVEKGEDDESDDDKDDIRVETI